MARHSKAKRQALKHKAIISHNVASLMGKFDTMSHRGYVCQNVAKPKEILVTPSERLQMKRANPNYRKFR